MNSLKRSFTFHKEQDIQSLIKQAIVPTNRHLDWNTCIKICTIVNCKKGASKKARTIIVKKLYYFKEPQTQYLATSLLKEICYNCAVFEDELRNQEFIDSLREIWHCDLHDKVRNTLGELISALGIKYKNDLYMHYLLDLCSIVGYHAPQPEIARVTRNATVPAVMPRAQDPFNDPRHIVRASTSTSTPTARINPIQMIMDINAKGPSSSSVTNESLSRFELDELLNQAEVGIQVFKEALESQDKDLLKDLHDQNKLLHHRLIQQAWLLNNDILYQEALLDAARNIYFLLCEYKKSDH